MIKFSLIFFRWIIQFNIVGHDMTWQGKSCCILWLNVSHLNLLIFFVLPLPQLHEFSKVKITIITETWGQKREEEKEKEEKEEKEENEKEEQIIVWV